MKCFPCVRKTDVTNKRDKRSHFVHKRNVIKTERCLIANYKTVEYMDVNHGAMTALKYYFLHLFTRLRRVMFWGCTMFVYDHVELNGMTDVGLRSADRFVFISSAICTYNCNNSTTLAKWKNVIFYYSS